MRFEEALTSAGARVHMYVIHVRECVCACAIRNLEALSRQQVRVYICMLCMCMNAYVHGKLVEALLRQQVCLYVLHVVFMNTHISAQCIHMRYMRVSYLCPHLYSTQYIQLDFKRSSEKIL